MYKPNFCRCQCSNLTFMYDPIISQLYLCAKSKFKTQTHYTQTPQISSPSKTQLVLQKMEMNDSSGHPGPTPPQANHTTWCYPNESFTLNVKTPFLACTGWHPHGGLNPKGLQLAGLVLHMIPLSTHLTLPFIQVSHTVTHHGVTTRGWFPKKTQISKHA